MIYVLIAIVSFSLGFIACIHYMNMQIDPKYKECTLFTHIAQDMLNNKKNLKELENTLISINEYFNIFEDLQKKFDMHHVRTAPETMPTSSHDHSLKFLFNEIYRHIPVIEKMRLHKKQVEKEIERIRENIEYNQHQLDLLRDFMS